MPDLQERLRCGCIRAKHAQAERHRLTLGRAGDHDFSVDGALPIAAHGKFSLDLATAQA